MAEGRFSLATENAATRSQVPTGGTSRTSWWASLRGCPYNTGSGSLRPLGDPLVPIWRDENGAGRHGCDEVGRCIPSNDVVFGGRGHDHGIPRLRRVFSPVENGRDAPCKNREH